MGYYTTFAWRGVRVAEGAAFEMRSAGNRRGGSNPSLSDTNLLSRNGAMSGRVHQPRIVTEQVTAGGSGLSCR